MRMLFASNFAGDSVPGTYDSDTSLNNHGIAARSNGSPYSGLNRNAVSFGGSLVLATGLRGTGKCWVKPPTISLDYSQISVGYPETIDCSNFAFDFKFATDTVSQTILTTGQSGTVMSLTTNGSGQLVANVDGTPYTSSFQPALGTVYNCEYLLKLSAGGAGGFYVRIDGVPANSLSATGLTIVSGANNVITNTIFDNATADNLHVGAFIWRGGDDALSESLFLGGGEHGKIARVQDLFPIADGHYTSYRGVSGSFGGVGALPPYQGDPDPTYATDYESIAETTFDGFLHYLMLDGTAAANGDPPIPQSWIHEPFDDYIAGTVPDVIGVFQHIIGAGDGGDIMMPFLRMGGADYFEEKFQNIAVAAPAGNLEEWWLVSNSDSQFGPCAIAYDTNPATGVAWTAEELQALEGCCQIVRWNTGLHWQGRQKTIGQALLTVVWVDGPAVSDHLYTLPITGVGW